MHLGSNDGVKGIELLLGDVLVEKDCRHGLSWRRDFHKTA